MRICIPTEGTAGLKEKLYGHFGSAPYFTIIDTESGSVTHVTNADQNHVHGQCNPIAALAGEQVDALVVQGIGGGAAARLTQAGVDVYQAQVSTVAEAVQALQEGKLLRVTITGTCNHHGHGHNCH